uniref:Uncharacterized protein n=1 Tax=Triticum urartu TaxID=4572 RepID=A0A8R7U731_TRIUA
MGTVPPPPPCAAVRSGCRDGEAALPLAALPPGQAHPPHHQLDLLFPSQCPAQPALLSGFWHGKPPSPTFGLSPTSGRCCRRYTTPTSMPLQLPAATSIAFSRFSGYLHSCTPAVRSIDPTDRSLENGEQEEMLSLAPY